jgi:hypothetical protein
MKNILKKNKIKYIILLMLFFVSLPVKAATLEMALEKNITSVKDDVVVLVTINSEGQDVNTAQATISFPANLLEVTKIDQTSSVFSFWLEQPTFDNRAGTISFVGGSTSGLKGSGLKIMHIAFRVKGSGSGRLGVTNGAITASDGTGSNVYNTSKGLDINIPTTAEFQAVKVERATRAITLAKELPTLLGFSVPFYPDPTKWNNRSSSFQANWAIGSDVTRAGIILNKEPVFTPPPSAEALSGNKIFGALTDGVWYLHLRTENNIGWSPTLHYRIAVDTAPPTPFKITSVDGFKTGNPSPIINFSSSDLVSGIDNYNIRLDGKDTSATSSTSYRFSPLLPGVHYLVVTATDKAGNSISQTSTLDITPISSPVITYFNRKIIVDEGEIVAGGTVSVGNEVVVQVQNAQKQIVAEQTVPADSKGGWNVTISKSLSVGDYHLLATARDKNMASSFPVSSDIISVQQRPALVIGSIEVSQAWFFVIMIIVLLGSFGVGWFSYRSWRGQLERKVVIARRDVVNIIENLDKEIDKILKDSKKEEISKSDFVNMKYSLEKMKESLEKAGRYVVENIKEICN